jgi:hypothetical protein
MSFVSLSKSLHFVAPFGQHYPWRWKARSATTMRRKRLSLAKRRHRELRSFAGAPLRRFLAKCRSRYHFFDMAHDQAPGEADRRNGRRRLKKAGHETRKQRSEVRSWRCCHHLRLLAVTHYRRREVEVSRVPRRGCAANRNSDATLQRLPEVPSPPSIRWPISAMAR